MFSWEICAGFASLALGSFGIPLQFTNDKLSSFGITALYGAILVIQSLVLHYYVPNKYGEAHQWNFQMTTEWGWALLSVLIQSFGVQALLFGVVQEDVILSLFFAIVSTQTLWSTFLSLLFLGEWKRVIVWKMVVGTVSVVGGVLLMTQGIKPEREDILLDIVLSDSFGTFLE